MDREGIRGWITPAPATSWFRSSGALEGYNEDFALIGASLIACAVVDLMMRAIVVRSARYAALHVLANAAVCAFAAIDVVHVVLGDPAIVFWGSTSSMVPTSVAAALHLYHIAAFDLTAAEVIEDLVFALLPCIVAIPLKNIIGCATNFGTFFLTGLPGMINYLLQVLRAHDRVAAATEQKWIALINLSVRGPSQVLYLLVAYTSWFNPAAAHRPRFPLWFYVPTIGAAILHFVNGQYYARLAVEANQIHRMQVKP